MNGGQASCKQSDAGVEVTLGKNASEIDTIVEIALASPAAEIKPIPTPVTPQAENKK